MTALKNYVSQSWINHCEANCKVLDSVSSIIHPHKNNKYATNDLGKTMTATSLIGESKILTTLFHFEQQKIIPVHIACTFPIPFYRPFLSHLSLMSGMFTTGCVMQNVNMNYVQYYINYAIKEFSTSALHLYLKSRVYLKPQTCTKGDKVYFY